MLTSDLALEMTHAGRHTSCHRLDETSTHGVRSSESQPICGGPQVKTP
jgi:hypothetical protein